MDKLIIILSLTVCQKSKKKGNNHKQYGRQMNILKFKHASFTEKKYFRCRQDSVIISYGESRSLRQIVSHVEYRKQTSVDCKSRGVGSRRHIQMLNTILTTTIMVSVSKMERMDITRTILPSLLHLAEFPLMYSLSAWTENKNKN